MVISEGVAIDGARAAAASQVGYEMVEAVRMDA
jgi:hypothetical protein